MTFDERHLPSDHSRRFNGISLFGPIGSKARRQIQDVSVGSAKRSNRRARGANVWTIADGATPAIQNDFSLRRDIRKGAGELLLPSLRIERSKAARTRHMAARKQRIRSDVEHGDLTASNLVDPACQHTRRKKRAYRLIARRALFVASDTDQNRCRSHGELAS